MAKMQEEKDDLEDVLQTEKATALAHERQKSNHKITQLKQANADLKEKLLMAKKA